MASNGENSWWGPKPLLVGSVENSGRAMKETIVLETVEGGLGNSLAALGWCTGDFFPQ